jgi:tetratricopeptide (TPR) repeat protein
MFATSTRNRWHGWCIATPATVSSNRSRLSNPGADSRLDHSQWCTAQAQRAVYLHFQSEKRQRTKQMTTMTERFQTGHPELDDLFERFRSAPRSHVFAPLADACRKAGMLEEALEICARGVGEHPRYASGYVVQGKCLYDAGRAGDAEAAFERVLSLDPKNLVALKYLGMLHAERGDHVRATEYFEHILALDPDNREIRSHIEDIELARQRAPQASVRAEVTAPVVAANDDEEPALLPDIDDEGFEGEPITLRDETVTSDEIATMTLADIYASQGYTSRALKIYREVHKHQPDNAALSAKIEVLEKQVSETVAAARAADLAESEAALPAETTAPVAENRKPIREREDAAPAARQPATPPQGTPIDQTRNYEQFKRWLKATSR